MFRAFHEAHLGLASRSRFVDDVPPPMGILESRATALKVAKLLVAKSRGEEAVELLCAWAVQGPNDAGGNPMYKLTREEDINIGNGDSAPVHSLMAPPQRPSIESPRRRRLAQRHRHADDQGLEH